MKREALDEHLKATPSHSSETKHLMFIKLLALLNAQAAFAVPHAAV